MTAKELFGLAVVALGVGGCGDIGPSPSQTAVRQVTPTMPPTEILPTQVLPTEIPSVTATNTPTSTPPTVDIVTTGDVMLGRRVRRLSDQHNDIYFPFRNIQGQLPPGILLINFEGTFTDPCPLTYTAMIFCAPPDHVSALTWEGVDVANLANNHMLDYGEEGKETTIRTLTDAGIVVSNEDNLAILERGGVRFGFIGFDLIKQSSDYPILPEQEILNRVKESAAQVDVLVVSMHWGNEYVSYLPDDQKRIGHELIDAGAALVVGTHPHVVVPIEEYNGGIIVGSLGNFVFDANPGRGRAGEVVVFEFVGTQLASYRTISIRINEFGQPEIVHQ